MLMHTDYVFSHSFCKLICFHLHLEWRKTIINPSYSFLKDKKFSFWLNALGKHPKKVMKHVKYSLALGQFTLVWYVIFCITSSKVIFEDSDPLERGHVICAVNWSAKTFITNEIFENIPSALETLNWWCEFYSISNVAVLKTRNLISNMYYTHVFPP